MTNPITKEQILRKAIEEAVKNGWKAEGLAFDVAREDESSYFTTKGYKLDEAKKVLGNLQKKEKDRLKLVCYLPVQYYANVIYEHDFARAFWGEEDVCGVDGNKGPFCEIHSGRIGVAWKPAWRYHLQQQVLSDDPITYLTKGL